MEFIKKVQTMMDTDENIFTMIYGTKPGNQIKVKGLFNMKSPKHADSFHFEQGARMCIASLFPATW